MQAAVGESGFFESATGAVLALAAPRMRGLYLSLVKVMVMVMAAGVFQILLDALQFPDGGDGLWGVARQSTADIRPGEVKFEGSPAEMKSAQSIHEPAHLGA